MKMRQIVLAVAATLVAGQAAAAAVTQADIAAARTAGTLKQTWFSGSSAAVGPVSTAFLQSCDAGTAAAFTSDTSAAKLPLQTGNYNAYACKRGGVVSVLYHTAQGGSFNVWAPHLPAAVNAQYTGATALLTRVKELGSNNPACAANGSFQLATTTNPANAITVAFYHGCSTMTPTTTVAGLASDNGPNVSEGGFSDVEPNLFNGATNVGTAVSSIGTTGPANFAQVFGVVVNPSLYRQLQVAQGIYTTTALAASGDPSYAPANAPSISLAQYASIASGSYNTDWSPLIGTAGAGRPINLARRVSSSGTQASSNAVFLRDPCDGDPTIGGVLNPSAATDSIPGAYIVTEGSGTTNVKQAITSAELAGQYAIGVVSLENDWRAETATDRNAYRFVKVNGVHPEEGEPLIAYPSPAGGTYNTYVARASGISGNYIPTMEMVSFSWSGASAFGSSLLATLTNQMSNPVDCAELARGVMILPTSPSSCAIGSQVAKWSKSGNNCQQSQMFY